MIDVTTNATTKTTINATATKKRGGRNNRLVNFCVGTLVTERILSVMMMKADTMLKLFKTSKALIINVVKRNTKRILGCRSAPST